MDKNRKDFSGKLNHAMLEKGWNQSELARRAGIGRDNVSGYVRGHNLPNSKHLSKLATALNVPPSYLLGAATGDRFPAMEGDDKPLLKIEQIPDSGMFRLSLRQELPEDVVYQIATIIRKSKGV